MFSRKAKCIYFVCNCTRPSRLTHQSSNNQPRSCSSSGPRRYEFKTLPRNDLHFERIIVFGVVMLESSPMNILLERDCKFDHLNPIRKIAIVPTLHNHQMSMKAMLISAKIGTESANTNPHQSFPFIHFISSQKPTPTLTNKPLTHRNILLKRNAIQCILPAKNSILVLKNAFRSLAYSTPDSNTALPKAAIRTSKTTFCRLTISRGLTSSGGLTTLERVDWMGGRHVCLA